jgi:hypothetical protein
MVYMLVTSCKPKISTANLQKQPDHITLPPVAFNTNKPIPDSPPEDVKGIPADIKEIKKAYLYIR